MNFSSLTLLPGHMQQESGTPPDGCYRYALAPVMLKRKPMLGEIEQSHPS